MQKRFTFAFVVVALLVSYVVQAKPTWIIAHPHPTKTASQIKTQVECLTRFNQWKNTFEQVQSAATDEQKQQIDSRLQVAKQLLAQNKCNEVLKVLTDTTPVLKTVQTQWLEEELENLDHLFMGPSTVEQRALLRTHIKKVKLFKEKGRLEEAVATAQQAEELFDNPPALNTKQLRQARYDDAMEGLEILYELAEFDIEDNPQVHRQVEKIHTQAQYEIYNVWRNTALTDQEQSDTYEQILSQVEKDLDAALTVKKIPAAKKKTTK